MLLVFVLSVFVSGQEVKPKSYWYDINRCLYFAEKLSGSNALGESVKAHCMPTMVDVARTQVYR